MVVIVGGSSGIGLATARRFAREGWRVVVAAVLTPWPGRRSLRRAAEMALLYDGVTSTLPFLLVD